MNIPTNLWRVTLIFLAAATLRAQKTENWSFKQVQAEIAASNARPARPEVWMITPWTEQTQGDMFRDLFRHSEAWQKTRARINALGYADEVMDRQFTDAELRRYFAQMGRWKLKLALEVGGIKPGYPTAEAAFARDTRYWNRYLSLGADIDSVSMDEPLLSSRVVFKKDDAYAVDQTAKFIALVRERYPTFRIGDVEPYPSISLADHLAWIDALQSKLHQMNARGLDFYRVDVNWIVFTVNNRRGNWMEVKNLETACHDRHLPFGMIYWSSQVPVLEQLKLADDSTWYTEIMEQGYAYKLVGGDPDLYILESWVGLPHESIPETAPWSFTRSVLDFTDRFVPPGRP